MARSLLALPICALCALAVSGCGRNPEAVPFVCQAPTPADWNNPIFQDGCEEACITMIAAWIRGDLVVSPRDADGIIHRIAIHEEVIWGFHADTGLEDTQRLLVWYFKVNGWSLPEMKLVSDKKVSVKQLQRDLAAGYVVLLPIDATDLRHPNYKSPPLVHMVLVLGYDKKSNKLIINDPGTSHGAKLSIFTPEQLISVTADYKSGNKINNPGDLRVPRYLAIR